MVVVFIHNQHQLLLTYMPGPVLRISPTMLLVSDATKLPDVYARDANKAKYYITGSCGTTEMSFNIQDHRTHAKMRKLIAGPYAFSHVKKMEPLLDTRITQWITKLDHKFAATGDVFDFSPWAIFLAYDIISEIGFGAPVGFVEAETDVSGLIKGFHDGTMPFGVLGRLWPLTNLLKKTFIGEKYLVAKPEDNSGFGLVMRFRDRLLEERKRNLAEGKELGRNDLLQT
jgi:cytochrome P450